MSSSESLLPMASSSIVFFVPSIHDGKMLECRVRHPYPRSKPSCQGSQGRSPKGVILAHPYAPLGGCFDDPIVACAAGEFLREDFIVGTFNFRGAGASEGRTSWTARAELDDYISFAGFFIHYLHGLAPVQPGTAMDHEDSLVRRSALPGPNMRPALSAGVDHEASLVLVLGGYSYGSMITTLLPDINAIVERFMDPPPDSVAAKIRTIAKRMVIRGMKDARQGPASELLTASGDPLGSGDSVNSRHGQPEGLDPMKPGTEHRVRRSFDRVRSMVSRKSADETALPRAQTTAGHRSDALKIETCYLLISPLLPPVSALVALFTRTPYMNVERAASDGANENLVARPTLAIYGDRDMFTAARKLQQWARLLAERPGSRFQSREIPDAGHFWRENGVEEQLQSAIREWLTRTVLTPGMESPSPVDFVEQGT